MSDWFEEMGEREKQKTKADGEPKVIQERGKNECVVANVQTEVEAPIKRSDVH